jgi:hypothetical protein
VLAAAEILLAMEHTTPKEEIMKADGTTHRTDENGAEVEGHLPRIRFAHDDQNDDLQTIEGTRGPRSDEDGPGVEAHMPRIRWAQNEQPATSTPTVLRRRSRRVFIAALIATLAVSALAPLANAAISLPDGGTAEMGVACKPASAVRTWGSTYKTTGYYIQFNYYVQSLSYPHLSGWGGWAPMASGGYRDLGEIARRGSGHVKVMVRYAVWNGSAYQYYDEWLTFAHTHTPTCFV